MITTCLLSCPDEILNYIVMYTDAVSSVQLMRTCKRMLHIVRTQSEQLRHACTKSIIHAGLFGPLSVTTPLLFEALCNTLSYDNVFKCSALRSVESSTYVTTLNTDGCLTENACHVQAKRSDNTVRINVSATSSWTTTTGAIHTSVQKYIARNAKDIASTVLLFGRARVMDVLLSVYYPGMPFITQHGVDTVLASFKTLGLPLLEICRFLARTTMIKDGGHIRLDEPQRATLQDMYENGHAVHVPEYAVESVDVDVVMALNSINILVFPLRATQQHHLTQFVRVGSTAYTLCVRAYIVTQANTSAAGKLFVWMFPEACLPPSHYVLVQKITRSLSVAVPDAMFSTTFTEIGRLSVEYAITVLLRDKSWTYV